MPVDTLTAFLDEVRSLQLLPPDHLGDLRTLSVRFPEPRALAAELVRRGWLTEFQARQLLQGRGRELVRGPYRLLDVLGQGAMGKVFKARHAQMDRVVALKVIDRDSLPTANALARFQREMRAAAALQHPNIVLAYDADVHYLAMEHVEGVNLWQLVKQRGPLPIAEACDYVRQAALGLQHAHEKGLVHRDIKPSNLMRIAGSGGSATVKILDFGLARFASESGADARLTQLGRVVGTVDYIAPEQAENARTADIRADIYSLGCTLFYLLTAQPPFPGNDVVEKLGARLLGATPSVRSVRPEVPPALDAVLARMMDRDPARRYQTPAEVAAALALFAAPGPAREAVTPTPPLAAPVKEMPDFTPPDSIAIVRPRRRTTRRSGAWIIAASVVLVLGAGSGLWWFSRPVPRPVPRPGPAVTPRVEVAQTKLAEKAPPPPAVASISIARLDPITVEAGQSKVIGVQVQRTGNVGPVQLRVEDLPFGVSWERADRSPNGNGLALELTARRDAASAEKECVIVATAGDGELVTRSAVTVRLIGAPPPPGEVRRIPAVDIDQLIDVVVAADGRSAVVGRKTGGVTVWDLETGASLRRFTSQRTGVVALALAYNGRHVVTAGTDQSVCLWDIATGAELGRLATSLPVLSMAITRDGQRILTNEIVGGRQVRVWDASTGVELRKPRVPSGLPGLAKFSPDGQRVLFSDTAELIWWNLEESRELRRLTGKPASISSLAVASDERRVLAGSGDDKQPVTFWDLQTGKVLAGKHGQLAPVGCAVFSPDGQRALTGSTTGTIILWDARNGDELHRFGVLDQPVYRIAFFPDGRRAVSAHADRTLRVWQLPVSPPTAN